MRRFLSIPVTLLAAFFLPQSHAADRKPNVIIIVADDLGYGELGCQGNTEIPTPNIDSIARNGVRFTSGYVTAPVCTPSRAGLLTGRYQTRFGHELNLIGAQNLREDVGLPLTESTLANVLKSAGYSTGIVGKWHQGGAAKYHPLQRGFDEFFGFLHEGHFYVAPPYAGVTSFLRTNQITTETGVSKPTGDVIWSNHLRSNEPPYDDRNPLLRGTGLATEKEYLTDAFTREAASFIERRQSQPFFLYLAYNAVHSPMQAPPKYLDRFKHIPIIHRRVFAAMLSAMDDGVGAVLGKLHALNLEENTLLFFISDNGGPTAELTSSNQPLSGGKGQLLEGGVRIPFMVQWRNHLPAGKIFDQPVISLDMYSTILAATTAKPPTGRSIDGVDLLPHLTGANPKPPHDTLAWRYGQQAALRKGDWKIYRPGGQQPWQLFNLASDASETQNLAAQKPDTVKDLESAWTQWNAHNIPPLWGADSGRKKK